jgi:hypothetical protein
MTTVMRIPATKTVPMDSLRKTALVAGVFYLITFISIPTLALYPRQPRRPAASARSRRRWSPG